MMRRDTETFGSVLDANPVFLDTSWTTTSRVQEPQARLDELLKILIT